MSPAEDLWVKAVCGGNVGCMSGIPEELTGPSPLKKGNYSTECALAFWRDHVRVLQVDPSHPIIMLTFLKTRYLGTKG